MIQDPLRQHAGLVTCCRLRRRRPSFVKGHGTENDFVLLPDPDGASRSGGQVRALCDRHAGLGADGVIRVAPAGRDRRFFMDYRNADGSLAQMCGNGARVFARYLVDAGWARSGTTRVRHPRGGPHRAGAGDRAM